MDKMTTKAIAVAMLVAGGCSTGGGVESSDTTSTPVLAVMYNVSSPYRVANASPAGSDGFVYSVLPAAPLASDPWQLLFCYQSDCFTLSHPLEGIPSGEINIPLPDNATLAASGNLSCAGWSASSRVSWYDTTPLHWHVALNATCADGSFSIVGDWQRVN